MTHQILFVDKEPANLYLLEQLCGNDFQIIYAASGNQALNLLHRNNTALIISDEQLPDLDAFEFLKKSAAICPAAVRILTGDGDAETLVEAINSGVVHKYIIKPWINVNFERIIARVLNRFQINRQQCDHASRDRQTFDNTGKRSTYLIPLSTDLINSRADNRSARASRIGMYAAAIGQRLELPASEIEKLTLAAFNHERQTSAKHVTRETLPPNGKFTISECSLERNRFFPPKIMPSSDLADVSRHIGEHFDGSGLPDALTGEQIPLYSRIIAVAKAYDEEISAFPINQAGAHNRAIARLKKGSQTLYDPAIVSCFCQIESIGQIRRIMSEGFSGIRRLSVRIFCDAAEVRFAEMLDKIKTTPMLAMETLFLANEIHSGSPTSQLMVAANKLGETGLKQMMSDYGFPLSDPQMKAWAETALRRACAAQILAAYTDIINPDIAYTLGLLHDVGEILLSTVFPAEMRELRNIVDDQMRFNREVELFGVESAQVSRWLLEDCGISPNLAAAINSRHKVMRNDDPVSILLDVARRIATAEEENKTKIFDALNKTTLDILRLNRSDLDKIYNQTTIYSVGLINSHGEIYEFVEKALI